MRKKVKRPALNIGVKGMRGFAVTPAGYLLERGKFQHILYQEDPELVTLQPGMETEIIKSLPGLPPYAKLKYLNAELEIEETVLKQKADILEGGKLTNSFTVSVEGPTLPKNVTVRLVGGEVFWFNAGNMEKKTYNLTNIAEFVNIYIDNLPAVGDEVFLRFLIKSDTPGKAKIKIPAIGENDYYLAQPQVWINSLDDTSRIDRNYELDFCMVESEELNVISNLDPPGVLLNRIEMDIGGEFGQERLLGRVEQHDNKRFVTIGNDFAFAQKLVFEAPDYEFKKPVKCVGIVGYFQTSSEVELYCEIQNDINGVPALDSPLTKTKFLLILSDKNGIGKWAYSSLETQLDFKTNTPYWIVIKGVQGKALLGLKNQESGYLREILINRGGQSWKPVNSTLHSKNAALLRVVYFPELDNQTAAVEIGLKGTQFLEKLDPGPDVETLSFGNMSIGLHHLGSLNTEKITDSLRQEFNTANFRLSQQANLTIKTKDIMWLIDDVITKQKYIIKREGEALNTYVDIEQATFVIKSYARGTLSIANVIQKYTPA